MPRSPAIHTLTTLALAIQLMACGDDKKANYDDQSLARYRAAIPSQERLSANTPDSPGRLAGDAAFPNFAANAVIHINLAVEGIIGVMRTIVNLPPTHFNSDTKEFVWGPWDNDHGYGKVMAYIRENPAGADFKFTYALLRTTPDGDLAKLAPVIWGAATPDDTDPDRGIGVTLWDLVANAAFETTHNPTPPAQLGGGRFVALYGDLAGANGGSVAWNYAVFRNFDPADGTTPQNINLDLLYGKFFGNDGNTVGFLDWQQTADLCDMEGNCFDDYDNLAGSNGDEQLGIRLAFLNDGIGRGEVTVASGDLMTRVVEGTECWSAQVESTYFHVADNQGLDATLKELPGCVFPFTATLTDLDIPALEDIDLETRNGVICAAEQGLEACATE